MLVSNRMTRDPVTIGAGDLLSAAQEKMQTGGFRHVPVMSGGKLVGIITERDLRAHSGYLEQTKVNGIVGDRLFTIRPSSTVEEAAQRLLVHKIGGLPVVDDGRLVGIITSSDILKAFLDVMGASQPASTRIDFILEGEAHGLVEASRIVAREGGTVLGVGTYRERLGENPVCYLRILAGDPGRVAKALCAGGFDVLGVHESAD